jgi:hypothetical protein
VITNFHSTKAELNLKYRLGLEHALARADFLNAPNLTLVQAFAIFLFLVRRHDSPRFVWMMTGLVIRMAQSLGLHRDGSHFPNLSPFEVEMRRRVWWAVCMLDIRSSEDQGTDLTIANTSYDTKLPLNINDTDIDPDIKETPSPRKGVTDMTFALMTLEMVDTMRQMMVLGLKDGVRSLEDQSRMLQDIYNKVEQGYLQYSSESGNIAYWVASTATRLVVSKMTLLIYLPVLFTPSSEYFTDEIRNKLFIAAIEVAEYNHALNSEQACRQWRWVYQTYTHWYAVVYMLIEIGRRPWSPIVERAWIALHSNWLIPARTNVDKNLQIWVPLRKLMAKARRHRETELKRLTGNIPAITDLEMRDTSIPIPGSSGPFPPEQSVALFRAHWRRLLIPLQETGQPPHPFDTSRLNPSAVPREFEQPSARPGHSFGQQDLWSNTSLEPPYLPGGQQSKSRGTSSSGMTPLSNTATDAQSKSTCGYIEILSINKVSTVPGDWSGSRPTAAGSTPWLWPDLDPTIDVFSGVDVTMDLDRDVDWYNWLESAKDVEWSLGPTGARGS